MPIATNSPTATMTRAALICVIGVLCAAVGHAQDRLYTMNSSTAVTGQIVQITRNGVTIKSSGANQEIPADQIRKILHEGDPRQLTDAREFVMEGQYDQALPLLESLELSALKREVAQADAAFYRVYSQGQLALAGKGDKKGAAGAALTFAGKFTDSWHFFDAARLLGDLALSMGNYDAAIKYYGSLRSAPSVESKIAAVYLTATAYLEKGDLETAATEFDKVASVSVQSVEAARLQKLAKAGKAMALARGGKPKEGLEIVNSLISELNATDVELAARVYNAQGACFEAAKDVDGAILAYLHTHLMFSSQPLMHAQALAKLVQLWPQVGRPERAAEARKELQERYPGLAS